VVGSEIQIRKTEVSDDTVKAVGEFNYDLIQACSRPLD